MTCIIKIFYTADHLNVYHLAALMEKNYGSGGVDRRLRSRDVSTAMSFELVTSTALISGRV